MSTSSSLDEALPLQPLATLPRLRIPQWASLGSPFVRLLLAFVLPLALLALWRTATEQVWLPPQILPEPSFVWESLRDLAQSGELLGHVIASLQRVAISMAIGGAIGLALGFAMGLSPTVKAYVYPSFSLFAQFPVIAWTPLMIVFFGIDEALKVSTITVAVLVPFAVASYKGIQNVSVKLMEVGRVYQFSHRQTFLRIALPATLPALIGGLRQAGIQAWQALIFVEVMASSEGIGYLLVYSRNLMQLDVVMVCMAAIGAIGLAFDVVLGQLERRASRWQPKGF